MIKNLIFCFCFLFCSNAAMKAQTVPESEDSTDQANDSGSQVTNLAAVVKEKTKVLLNWRLTRNSVSEYVAVERSLNGREFEMVALLKQPASGDWYEWLDDSPGKGRNAYRIRYTNKKGVDQYSITATTLIAGDISFKFYPNPVENILIIRSEHPSDVQIIDSRGAIRISQAGFHGLQTLNVMALEKGIYILRVFNRVTGVISQEKLLKH